MRSLPVGPMKELRIICSRQSLSAQSPRRVTCKNKELGKASLKQGWNCLLVRNDHLQWQRQFACALLPVEGDNLDDLRYSVMPK